MNRIDNLGLTYDVCIATSAIEKIINEDLRSYKNLNNFFAALVEWEREYPIEIDEKTTSSYHFSLGHKVDIEKAKLLLSAKAIKTLPIDKTFMCQKITRDDVQGMISSCLSCVVPNLISLYF